MATVGVVPGGFDSSRAEASISLIRRADRKYSAGTAASWAPNTPVGEG